jgi:TLC domain
MPVRVRSAVAQITFALVFFCVRIVGGNYMSYLWWPRMIEYLSAGRAHSVVMYYAYMVSNIVLNGLNAFWFYQIIAGGKGKGKGKDKGKDKGDDKGQGKDKGKSA